MPQLRPTALAQRLVATMLAIYMVSYGIVRPRSQQNPSHKAQHSSKFTLFTGKVNTGHLFTAMTNQERLVG